MGPLEVLVMIALFVLVLVFIFSTALLTPLIGKRNLLFVIFLGFTVGAVGGVFFISPVLDDIPGMTMSVMQVSTTGTDVVGLNVSTEINITNFLENTKKIDGVKGIESSNVTIITDPLSPEWQTTFKNRIPISNPNITSVDIPNNKTIVLLVKNESNPQDAINGLEQWIMFVSGAYVKYSIVSVTLDVDASKLNQVISQLPQGDVVITSITGPTENNTQFINSIMPNKSNVVIICGFIGMITGLAGVFIDSILSTLGKFKERIIEFKNRK